MKASGYLWLGLLGALFSAFFLGMVLFNGPTLLGAVIGWLVVAGTVVSLTIGLIGMGVEVGTRGRRSS